MKMAEKATGISVPSATPGSPNGRIKSALRMRLAMPVAMLTIATLPDVRRRP